MANEAKALLDRLTGRQDEMVRCLKELVVHESPSDNKPAVDACGAVLQRQFATLGGAVTVHERAACGNILQIDFAGGSRSPVLLLGHFDTVYRVGGFGESVWREASGNISGPGIFDMKGGIVIGLFAMRALIETGGLPRPVRVLLNTDEEAGSRHSRELIEAMARDCGAVLVLEPALGPKGAVKTARKGVGEFTVRVTGVAAHSGLDFEKGHNAVLELARQIDRISTFTDLARGLTVSVNLVRGGERRNVVAAQAEAEVDVRAATAADMELVGQQFSALTPIDPGCRVEVDGRFTRPPMERTEQLAALYELARSVAAELGFDLGETAVGGASDGNFTAALGVPTLDGLGAIGSGAHSPAESIVACKLPRRAALLAGVIRRLGEIARL